MSGRPLRMLDQPAWGESTEPALCLSGINCGDGVLAPPIWITPLSVSLFHMARQGNGSRKITGEARIRRAAGGLVGHICQERI